MPTLLLVLSVIILGVAFAQLQNSSVYKSEEKGKKKKLQEFWYDCDDSPRKYCNDLPCQCADVCPSRNCKGKCRVANEWGWAGEDCMTNNLAFSKPATQSSTLNPHVAKNAVDGNLHNFAHTKNIPNSWWMVDLGVLSVVDYVRVYNREEATYIRLSYFNVNVGNCSDIASHSLCRNVDIVENGTFRDITCIQPMTARYVSIQLTSESFADAEVGEGFLTLPEVIVIGKVYCLRDDGECEPDDNPCQWNSTCTKINRSHACNCTEGYTGLYCDADINECADEDEVCKFGGTCNNTFGSFTCICAEGYQGSRCEIENLRTQVDCEANSLAYTLAAVFGCLLLIGCILVVFFIYYRRRRNQELQNRTTNETESSQNGRNMTTFNSIKFGNDDDADKNLGSQHLPASQVGQSFAIVQSQHDVISPSQMDLAQQPMSKPPASMSVHNPSGSYHSLV